MCVIYVKENARMPAKTEMPALSVIIERRMVDAQHISHHRPNLARSMSFNFMCMFREYAAIMGLGS